MLKIIKYGKLI